MAATQMEKVNIMQAKACLIDLLDQSTRKDDQK
jgi:hypothetical protein